MTCSRTLPVVRLLTLLSLILLGTVSARAEEPPRAQPTPTEADAPPPTEEAAPEPLPEEAPEPGPAEVVNTDPRNGEAPLAASSGWHASLVIDNGGVGIWTVKSYPFFEHLGCPEVIGLDDRGRCHVLMSYSGRWTPLTVLHDGKWLGGLTFGEVDPRVPGKEVYTGSQKGNIYQVRSYPHTLADGRLVARIEGREIHTLVAGELDPRSAGPEVLVFTRPGGLYRLSPTAPEGGFALTKLMDLPGRVRDAIVLPPDSRGRRAVATVSRTGLLELLRIDAKGPHWETLYKGPMGKGRIALRPSRTGGPIVLYSTHDDGRILRHEQRLDGHWGSEVIYLGPQGPRGIAAGRFGEDPDTETVAIFGYGKKVELLSRTPKGWQAETLFTDLDKGHWLAAAELDGRNGTRELLASGYSGRVVLLARPPGYGRTELATKR